MGKVTLPMAALMPVTLSFLLANAIWALLMAEGLRAE
jgi:hypothetical protein